MYVCICHAVTDREIQACVQDGARSLRELRHCLGVGTQCGKCVHHVRDILEEEKSGASSAAFASASLQA